MHSITESYYCDSRLCVSPPQIPENSLLTLLRREKVVGKLVAVVMMFLQVLKMQIKLTWRVMEKDTNFSFILFLCIKTCVKGLGKNIAVSLLS